MAVCQEGEPRIELGSSPSLGAGDGRPYRQVLESKDRVPEREDISRERERDLQRSAQDPLWFSAEHPSTHASVKTSWVSWKKKKKTIRMIRESRYLALSTGKQSLFLQAWVENGMISRVQ